MKSETKWIVNFLEWLPCFSGFLLGLTLSHNLLVQSGKFGTAKCSLLTKQAEFWGNPLEDKRAYVSQLPQKSPSLEQGTMTSQSQGIQQLLQAEKRAKDKLEEAKKSKCPLWGVGWKLQRDEGEDCGLLFQADLRLKCDVTSTLWKHKAVSGSTQPRSLHCHPGIGLC